MSLGRTPAGDTQLGYGLLTAGVDVVTPVEQAVSVMPQTDAGLEQGRLHESSVTAAGAVDALVAGAVSRGRPAIGKTTRAGGRFKHSVADAATAYQDVELRFRIGEFVKKLRHINSFQLIL